MQLLDNNIEIVPYGGKDTLKNTTLLQFVLKRFDRVFVTYDLDAQNDSQAALQRAGLSPSDQCLALGIQAPGRDCIEGILPNIVISSVAAKEVDLVMAMGGATDARKSAKNSLKNKYLSEFMARTIFEKSDLKELSRIIRHINKYFVEK